MKRFVVYMFVERSYFTTVWGEDERDAKAKVIEGKHGEDDDAQWMEKARPQFRFEVLPVGS